jgi:hypothetical protein
MFKFSGLVSDHSPAHLRMSRIATVGMVFSMLIVMFANKKIKSWRESRLTSQQIEMVDHVHRAVMICSGLRGKLDEDPAARPANAHNVRDDVSRYMLPQLNQISVDRDVDRKFREATLNAMQDWIAFYEAKNPDAKHPRALLRHYFDQIDLDREVESVPPAPPRSPNHK